MFTGKIIPIKNMVLDKIEEKPEFRNKWERWAMTNQKPLEMKAGLESKWRENGGKEASILFSSCRMCRLRSGNIWRRKDQNTLSSWKRGKFISPTKKNVSRIFSNATLNKISVPSPRSNIILNIKIDQERRRHRVINVK